jgi:Mg-chelatase subunit ChlD
MMTAIQKTYVPGSLAAQSATTGHSIAQTFVGADVIVLIDTSSSMTQRDGYGEKSRYDRACDELANVQASLPGKIAVLSFGDMVLFCPSGIPSQPCGMTDLTGALKFAKVADVDDMKFIVISDGEPNDEYSALLIASQYKNRIDTIYIGPEGGSGQRFLDRLAKESGGQAIKDFAAKQLAQNVKGLLNGG